MSYHYKPDYLSGLVLDSQLGLVQLRNIYHLSAQKRLPLLAHYIFAPFIKSRLRGAIG
jgi:hypothetical protein